MKEPATNNGCGRIPKNAEDKATTLRAQAWEKKEKFFKEKKRKRKKEKEKVERGKYGKVKGREGEMWRGKRN